MQRKTEARRPAGFLCFPRIGLCSTSCAADGRALQSTKLELATNRRELANQLC